MSWCKQLLISPQVILDGYKWFSECLDYCGCSRSDLGTSSLFLLQSILLAATWLIFLKHCCFLIYVYNWSYKSSPLFPSLHSHQLRNSQQRWRCTYQLYYWWTGLTNFHWLVARIRLLVSYSLHWVYPPELQACPWAERLLGHMCSIPFPSLTNLVGPQSEKWEEFEERLKIYFQYCFLFGSKTWFSSWKHWDREMGFPLTFYTCLQTSDCSCCLQDKIQTPFSVI